MRTSDLLLESNILIPYFWSVSYKPQKYIEVFLLNTFHLGRTLIPTKGRLTIYSFEKF